MRGAMLRMDAALALVALIGFGIAWIPPIDWLSIVASFIAGVQAKIAWQCFQEDFGRFPKLSSDTTK